MEKLYNSRIVRVSNMSMGIRPEHSKKFVSQYSKYNHREYFAECFSVYLSKPLKLKSIDPEAYDILSKSLLQ